jgi:hypothetical protein
MKKYLLIAILFIVGCAVNPENDQKADVDSTITKMSLEKKLALIDNNKELADTSLQVKRLGFLLKIVSANFNEPQDTISEYTSKAKGVLHDEGINQSCKNILEDMKAIGDPKGIKFKDAITLYLMKKTK